MARKILATIVSLITLLAIKESISIFLDDSTDGYRKPLIVLTLSITIPLVLLSLWLWAPKSKSATGRKKENQE